MKKSLLFAAALTMLFASCDKNDDNKKALVTLTSAAGVSLIVSAVDWILGKME